MSMTSPQPTLRGIAVYLDHLLEISKYQDMAINGLQVDASMKPGETAVSKVAFAVDCGLSIVEAAIKERCELLVVHHGVLWGRCEPLTGTWGRKSSLMMRNGLSLYAAHLPLDGHIELGNAAQLASVMGLTEVAGAFEYKGQTIGVTGQLPTPLTMEKVVECFTDLDGVTPPLVLPFGKSKISTVGIVTGSGTTYIADAAARGIDLLVTGEPKQEAYHAAKDIGQSVVCIGHYASETFGVRALQRVLARDFRVQTFWISEPTGI